MIIFKRSKNKEDDLKNLEELLNYLSNFFDIRYVNNCKKNSNNKKVVENNNTKAVNSIPKENCIKNIDIEERINQLFVMFDELNNKYNNICKEIEELKKKDEFDFDKYRVTCSTENSPCSTIPKSTIVNYSNKNKISNDDKEKIDCLVEFTMKNNSDVSIENILNIFTKLNINIKFIEEDSKDPNYKGKFSLYLNHSQLEIVFKILTSLFEKKNSIKFTVTSRK